MSLEPAKTLWTFPDEALSYECRGCAACCKGLGIGVDAQGGQVEALLGSYPALAPFFRQRGAAWTAANPRGGCWFLDAEGLCRVEREQGRAAKPASCRLFPFNRVFRLGSWAVVDFNSVICPLRAPLPGASEAEVGLSGRVRHAALLAEIGEVGDPAIVGTALPAQDPEAEGRALVEGERAIAAACFGAGASVEGALLAQLPGEGAAKARRSVDAALQAVFGSPWRAPGAETARVALLLTPSMRFNERYGPRAGSLELSRLPRQWLLWLRWLSDGEALCGRPLGLQEATSLWGELAGLAWPLSRWDEPRWLAPGPVSLGASGEVGALALRCAERLVANQRARRPLGEVLGPALSPALPHQRAAALRLVGELLQAPAAQGPPAAAEARRASHKSGRR